MICKTKYKTVGDNVDYKVVVKKKEERVYLVFQDSEGLRDWINNFRFPAEIYKNQETCLKVHKGYGRAWKSCNDIIMKDFIKKVKETGYKPTIVGWSYGGAMSQLAAEDFFYRTRTKPTVITFGSPKIFGNKASRELLRKVSNTIQFAHKNDIVTKLVPFYWAVKTVSIGKQFNIFKLFKPSVYHRIYGEKNLYE